MNLAVWLTRMDASPRTFFAWRQGVETNRIVLQWPLPREKRGQRRANAFISGVRARVGVSTAIRTIIGINQRAPLLSEVNPLAAFAYSRSIRWPPRLQLYRLRSVETVEKVELGQGFDTRSARKINLGYFPPRKFEMVRFVPRGNEIFLLKSIGKIRYLR